MLRQLTTNDKNQLKLEMARCQVDPAGINIMLEKGRFIVLKTSPLPAAGCNILKQQMLSVGGEVAISKGAANCSIDSEPAIIFGTRKQFKQLVAGLDYQCFGLEQLQEELREFLSKGATTLFEVGQQRFDLTKKTLIMGILNVTPDSFSDGGHYAGMEKAYSRVMDMIEQGADIIDIGGESTRPGAAEVNLKTELSRVIPVIEKIRQKSDMPISIDTYKSEVAEKALAAGADIVNDISGLNFDQKMIDVIEKNKASAVLMHIQGTPKNMQKDPTYENMIDEILAYLCKSAGKLRNLGIDQSKIALDPGIGFGKPWRKNYDIIRHLKEFKSAGYPLLVGPSRKSFIGKLLDLAVDDRLEGTLAAITATILNGADIVRVHDVKEAFRAIRVADEIVGKK